MDTLGKIFGSPARVKILRLFILNPDETFDIGLIADKSRVGQAEARREVAGLKKAGVIVERSFIKEIPARKGSKKPPAKKRASGFQLKPNFPLLVPLRNLLVSETPLNKEEIAKRFKNVGKVKFLALAGVFLDNPESRLDILIVGDNLKKRAIENTLRSVEAEVGKELMYSALETQEFLYRVGMYDKFVRDVLDFPHERIIDKLGVA